MACRKTIRYVCCGNSSRSANAMAVTASITTGTLSAMQRSCLPLTAKGSTAPVALFHVCCVRGVLLVGFTATLNTT